MNLHLFKKKKCKTFNSKIKSYINPFLIIFSQLHIYNKKKLLFILVIFGFIYYILYEWIFVFQIIFILLMFSWN